MSGAHVSTVVILGALSAIGEAVARLYAGEGARLWLVGRGMVRLEAVAAHLRLMGAAEVKVLERDLTASDPRADLAMMASAMGPLTDVVLAYGVLGDQALAERDPAQADRVMNVNYLSAAQWCLATAAMLEDNRAGTLVVIGSVAGDRGRQSNYLYGSTKAGLAVLVQGLAHRLSKVGARAALVKPGFVDTPMTAAFTKGPLWAKPETVARTIRAAARSGPVVVYAPWFWRWIMLVIRLVPTGVLHKTKL